MRPPRFGLRTLMIIIALLGLFLGSVAWLVRMGRKAAQLRQIAQRHAIAEAANHVRVYRRWNGHMMHDEAPGPKSAYHAAMRRKYEHAARSPWRPVEPDPPPP